MGQYLLLANLDKKEYVHPWRINGGAKLWEWCANKEAAIFPFLMAKCPKDGGAKPGRWAGDHVVFVGDYDESGLYAKAKAEFREISEELVREFNEYIGAPELKIEYRSPDEPKAPAPEEADAVELQGKWRKHRTHREETKAVKDALAKAGIKTLKVGHDTGTAWGWLVINLGPNPSGLEHQKMEGTPTPWLCAGGCPACERNHELENEVIRIAQEVTGRHGDYDGEINILMQEAE